MARDPRSIWKPLPEAGAPDGHIKTQFIVHSTGANNTAASTWRHFSQFTDAESTFIIGTGPVDPTLQLMDSTDRADANGSANTRAISVEVVGDGVGGFNDWQRAELIRLGRWARTVHPRILPRLIPAHDQPGFGWHVQFGAPGPWTSIVGKTCPGPRRITELKADIFPAIFANQEDDMAGPIAEEIRDVLYEGNAPEGSKTGTPPSLTIYQRLARVEAATARIEQQLGEVLAALRSN